MTTATLSRKGSEKPGLEGKILRDRYQLEKEIGRGEWGVVYRARDLQLKGTVVAIKMPDPSEYAKQLMEMREIESNREAIVDEALAGFGDYDHVIPNYFDFDPDFVDLQGNLGLPFLIMPFKGVFLSEVINDESEYRNYLGNGLDLEQIVRWLNGIALGAGELHRKGITHYDIKPNNIAVETVPIRQGMSDYYGEAKLADLGTKTFASISHWPKSFKEHSNGPRGNLYIRSPEAATDDKSARSHSDVFSLGAVGYRLITGEYPLEEEIDRGENPFEYSEEKFNKLIKNKCKKIKNKNLRELIERNLQFDPYKRDYDGNQFAKGLQDAVKKTDYLNGTWNLIRKALIWGAIPTALLAGASYKISTHEPLDLRKPENTIYWVPYKPIGKDQKLEFIAEKLELPTVIRGISDNDLQRRAKQWTNNRNVAYLVKTHHQALNHYYHENSSNPENDDMKITKHHWDVHIQRLSEQHDFNSGRPDDNLEKTWDLAIEQAIDYSMTDGKCDLEDTMAVSRIGIKPVEEAKRIARSVDWKNYSRAKYSNGDFVIPEKEQNFVNLWRTYYDADVD